MERNEQDSLLMSVCRTARAWREQDIVATKNKGSHKAQSAEYRLRQEMRAAIDAAVSAESMAPEG
jgi:hypothetical protein